jgi:hypothetical protein
VHRGPRCRQILLTDPQEQLGDLTVADLFFESREPPADEYEVEVLVLEESGNQTISVGFIRTG